MSTNVKKTKQLHKFCVERYSFRLYDNAYDCSVLDKTRLSEPWTERVTVEEIRSFVTNEQGQVDASFISPSSQVNVQFLEFDYYMTHEFRHEAKAVLSAIINKRAQEKEISNPSNVACHA